MTDLSIAPGPSPAAPAAHHQYRAYGLAIHSELWLPELQPHPSDAPDVVVRRGALKRPPLGRARFEFGDAEQHLEWPGLGQFRIRGASEVTVQILSEADERTAALSLLGAVIATVLHKRDRLVLHGSALNIDGAAALFLGDKGAGKSTTAAAFVSAGHRLLTDDVLAIDMSQAPQVMSAYPQVKVTAAAADVHPLPGAVALAVAFGKTRFRLPAASFSAEPIRPGAVYILVRGQKTAITPLPPAQALAALMRFSYLARFGDQLIKGPSAVRHLNHCAALTSAAPVCMLETPSELERLGEVVALVERHARG